MTRRKIRNVTQAFYEGIWLMTPDKLTEISNVLERRAAGVFLSPEEIRAACGDEDNEIDYGSLFGESLAPEAPYHLVAGGTAIVPIQGILSKRMNMLTNVSGGTSTEALASAIGQAGEDPDVKQVVLDVDSPGGSVQGIPETAAAIRQLAQSKRVIAVANEGMHSAAYWLGSAAHEILIYPTSELGSIGVYTVHTDTSEMDAKLGRKRTVIKAGLFKAAGQLPLTDEVRGDLQAKVDRLYEMFTSGVATNRPRLTAEAVRATEARSYLGEEAIKAGLADRFGSLNDVVRAAGVPPRKITVSAFVPAD